MLALGAMTTAASAEPTRLTGEQMDTITAGTAYVARNVAIACANGVCTTEISGSYTENDLTNYFTYTQVCGPTGCEVSTSCGSGDCSLDEDILSELAEGPGIRLSDERFNLN
jgi:hypothetical protein